MSASWYDVLGVAPDASRDEIRAAWRGSIEGLDPTDRRFAMYNEAAGVLLDDDRRAAYDAELAAGPAEPQVGEPAPTPDDSAPSVISEARRLRAPKPAKPPRAPKESNGFAWTGPQVPTWLLAALALATLVVAGAAAWVQLSSEDGAAVESALSDAREAAEDSVPKVFTYDHRFPERDRDQGARVLTGELRADYERLWKDLIAPNLAKTQGTAQSEVLATGAVRGGEDRAEVLVVLNSVTGNKNQSQQLTLALTATMVHEDGRWLIENLDGWDPEAVTEDSESPSPGASGAPAPEDSDPSPSPTE